MGKFIDLTGQRFGRLVVIEKTENPRSTEKSKIRYWLCKCDCGNNSVVSTHNLRNGTTKSCGCYRTQLTIERNIDSKLQRRFKNIVGNKFGLLTVLSLDYCDKQGSHWICKCDCGNRTTVRGNQLRNGSIKSCGCQQYKNSAIHAKIAREIYHKNRLNFTDSEMIVRKLLSGYRSKAEERNLEFELSFESFQDLIFSNCYYCGKSPSNAMTGKSLSSINRRNSKILRNGIDRVNNKIGYTVLNSVPCCEICNRMKLALGQQEFLDHIERIYNHSIKGKNNE
jgi:hypothetical protein